MPISAVTGGSPGYKSPETLEVERGVLVLAKGQDVAKVQAQALVNLIKQATPSGRLDVYA